MNELIKKLDLSNLMETAEIGAPPTRLSQTIFFILALILVFTVIAYGAVDAWAWLFLSILTGAIVVLWLVEAWREKEFRLNPSALLIPIVGLILIGLIQLLPVRSSTLPADLTGVPVVSAYSLDAYATRFFVVQLIVYLIFFAAALTFINSRQRLQKIVLTIIIFGGLMAFFGILQRLANPDAIYGLRQPQQAIFFASFINQHHFAALMNMTLGLTLGVLFGKAAKKDKNLLLIIAAFLMAIALLFTGSRGGLLSFLGVTGFLILPKLFSKQSENQEENGNPPNRLILIIGIFALIAGLFAAVLLLGGDQSLTRGIGFVNDADFSNGRLHFWAVALKIFFAHPILGAGLDAFAAAFTRYDTWNGFFRIERAHNDYLQILADAGIVGFACVAGFIYLLFKKGLPVADDNSSNYRRSVANGALAGCFGILIHSFFDFPLRTPANTFFFLTLAAIATVSIYYPKTPKRIRNQETER